MTPPPALSVIYFDGKTPRGIAATLLLSLREALLIGEHLNQRYPTSALRAAPAVADAERFILLPDGGQLLCRDVATLRALPQEEAAEGWAHRLEQRWPVALAALVIVVLALAAAYVFALPKAAEWAAARIPASTEKMIGDQTLEWLSSSGWFSASKVPTERQQKLRADFGKLVAGLPRGPDYLLQFRQAPIIGPNAFALPGGSIVMTDEMVEAAQSDEELLAVLAHEVGHQELRHTLREILHDSAIAVAVTAVTADAASLSVAISGLPVIIAQTSYSRQFESDADDFAFALLKREGISPDAFADLMERLGEGAEAVEREMSFMATHPVTLDRVAKARAAAHSSP